MAKEKQQRIKSEKKTLGRRPAENTLRRIRLYRKLVSPMEITAAVLKMADPKLKETLRMNREA